MELISVHVPKTAGVTFRNVLLQVYGAPAVHFDYGDRALDPRSTFQSDPAAWQAETHRQVLGLSDGLRVIHGHFGGAKYATAFPAAARVIWLRDPVARLISHYHYWRELPPTQHTLHRRLLEENLSLLDFARLEPMRNILARVFLRDCDLRAFAFIGIQEYFASDLALLAQQLGWPSLLPPGEDNRNRSASYQANPPAENIRTEIADLNAADMEIYHAALSRRAEREQSKEFRRPEQLRW